MPSSPGGCEISVGPGTIAQSSGPGTQEGLAHHAPRAWETVPELSLAHLQTVSTNYMSALVLVTGSTLGSAPGGSEKEARAVWRREHLGLAYGSLGKLG